MHSQTTKTEKKVRKEKKKVGDYFTQKTEDAIVKFQKEENLEKQKKIFVKSIKPAFDKLIENILFVYKFHTLDNIDILKNDCFSFLFENLYKYDSTRGHKAFSYFNVVAKNYFIQKVKNNKKKKTVDIRIEKESLPALEKKYYQVVVEHPEEFFIKSEFYELLKDEVQSWECKFSKDQEKKVLNAVIYLLNSFDENLPESKKSIYLLLREFSSLNTKQVVTNLIKFRKKYYLFKKKYMAGEV